uniref:Uncharacterized protein n=1 Tax=Arundo donax TaxID=35708 RepID=A0A0A9EMW6_ARUDO
MVQTSMFSTLHRRCNSLNPNTRLEFLWVQLNLQ